MDLQTGELYWKSGTHPHARPVLVLIIDIIETRSAWDGKPGRTIRIFNTETQVTYSVDFLWLGTAFTLSPACSKGAL
jgi:hypothetical protein